MNKEIKTHNSTSTSYDSTVHYSGTTYSGTIYSYTTNRIEQIIKALGTMVLIPTETSDPNNIGQKIVGAPVQRPILEGEARTKVLNKLVELITG